MSRKAITTRLKDFLTPLHGGRYWVHRGPVNWARFDFPTHPYAVAIMLDDVSLFRNEKGHLTATLTLEVFTRLSEKQDGLNDDIMDDLQEDVVKAFTLLKIAVDDNGNAVVFRLFNGTAVEVYDASLSVQGMIASVVIDF